MKAYVQLARVRNFFEFFALLHANLSGHWSVKQRPASRSVGRSVGRSRQLTSSRPTSSRQWSLVGPKIRPSGRENRVAQTSLHSRTEFQVRSQCVQIQPFNPASTYFIQQQ
ncbi:hypothetical protein T4D_8581 [Trichinella pseudospiralis]|uniref:Uncharacterized protein n=1 Tax=Trichinella pseudospiralis TaxID=6337 RepID=A0A0V1FLF8_TRIPS|nr:hypothetical protein T4D_8581 [Trichinella pseudospiralis]